MKKIEIDLERLTKAKVNIFFHCNKCNKSFLPLDDNNELKPEYWICPNCDPLSRRFVDQNS
jgi:formylmethanofuran dehydrogenase subunit E